MRVAMQMKDLNILKKACENMGLSFVDTKSVTSQYAGKTDALGRISDGKGGEAAVVKSGEGYALQIDEWNNPLVDVVGSNCANLTREYTMELCKEQAAQVGLINSQEVQQDGSVILQGVFI
jgi:hypothetical protein